MGMTTLPPAPNHEHVFEDVAPDPEALFEVARQRQRRRRRGLLAAATVAVAVLVGYGIYRSESSSPSAAGNGGLPVSGGHPRLVLRIAGFGWATPVVVDQPPCPQGRTVFSLRTNSGSPIGSLLECVLTISQHRLKSGRLVRIVQTTRGRYTINGSSITTEETQSFRFTRDQHHSAAQFTGRIISGTGRFKGISGSVSGGGPAVDGKANWTVRLDRS